MWKFKQEQSQRELYILQKLFIMQESPTLDVLMSELHCDIKTVTRTINIINETYMIPQLYINNKTKRLSVDQSQNFYSVNIFSQFFENTLEFQILEYLFLYAPVTKKDILEEFFISMSTLNRHLKEMKLNLKKYSVYIEDESHRLVGDEMKVRSFFIQYYYEKNTCSQFNRMAEFNRVSYELFSRFTTLSHFHRMKSMFNYFAWILFVTMIRTSQNQRIESETDLPEIVTSNLDYLFSESTKKEFERIFEFSMDAPQNVVDILYILIPNNSSKHRLNSPEVKLCVLELCHEFNETFNLQLHEKEVYEIGAIVFGILISNYGRAFFLFNKDENSIQKLHYHFPSSLEKSKEIIDELALKIGINEKEVLPTVLMTVLAYLPNIIDSFSKYEKTIEVKLFLVASDAQVKVIHTMLNERFKHLATFTLMDPNTLLEAIDIKDDIWISDSRTLFSDRVLTIESTQIYDEFSRIEKYLFEMRNRKLRTS